MPNGFNPKDLLKAQAALPQSVLSATPLAQLGVGLSGVLNQIAAQVPEIPTPGNGGPSLAGMGPLADVMKNIQAALPAGLPKLPGGNSNPAAKTPSPTPSGAVTAQPAARPVTPTGKSLLAEGAVPALRQTGLYFFR